jgi:segregation and condensation protein B
LRLLDTEGLVEETIDIFGEIFSQEVLASIASELEEIAGADDVSEEEVAFVDAVIERWQIEPAEADEGEEEEQDEEEAEDDEEGEDEDEEEDEEDEEEDEEEEDEEE